MRLLGFVLALFLATCGMSSAQLRFALVPKATENPFFMEARDGCVKRAGELPGVECVYVGPDGYDPAAQARLVDKLIGERIDGLAISVADVALMSPAIKWARSANIPVITFDADAPNSERQVYVGTDNRGFGRTMGEELAKLRPEGGTYAIISGGAGARNLAERVLGVREGLEGSAWKEVPGSPLFSDDDGELALRQMAGLTITHPKIGAILPVGGWPMFVPEGWKAFVDAHREDFDAGRLLLIAGDAVNGQLELLKQGYATMLVGQRPSEMGARAMDLLLALKQGRNTPEIVYSGVDVITRENVDEFLEK